MGVDDCTPLGHDAAMEHERRNVELRKAASLCDVRGVRRALARGAHANARARDQLGQAALHLAAQWRCPSVLGEVLLEAGADVEQRCDLGLTPLDRAVKYGNHKMARLLREAAGQESSRHT
eukprot:TRINITY_DN13025_c0_g2_i1.p1 TRINITY_DN13025_c0_g2~~TRINITY_DN13025_c0_g2_i1.p1  ORF type:complete len:121 (-),score=16.41 TRINITY_DN13025_c0_g2_i1:153-515(-)